MIKYYVRTTLERELNDSYNQVPYKLLIDKEHNARKSFVEQLEYLSTLKNDVVILEDDLLLCKDFKNRIEKVISEHKDEIINFFYYPKTYFKSKVSSHFMWNQCVYYPNRLLKELAVEMRKCYEKEPLRPHDEVENIALNNLKITNYIYRPCLVQHLDYKSLISPKNGKRFTPYFIDYLDELGIFYENAEISKNRIALKTRMTKDIIKRS